MLLQTAAGFSRRDIAMPEGIFSLEVADTGRDGVADLVVFRWERGTFAVYRGDGDGGFTFSHESGSNLYAVWFTLADLNHDGRLDLAYYSTGRVIVILAQGNTAWGPAVEYPSTPNNLEDGATFGDFNHDGHVDAFTWAGELLPGRGDGTFGEPSPFDVSPFGAGAVDLNRDGLLDIVSVTEVVLNERRAQNRPPVANAGPDLTLRYAEQFDFEDGGPLPFHLSSDPDLHRLTQQWQHSDGRSPFNGFGVFDPQPPGTYTLTLTASDGRGGQDTDTMRLTVLPEPEIVLHAYASLHGQPIGGWQTIEDSTAASGSRLTYPNARAPRVDRRTTRGPTTRCGCSSPEPSMPRALPAIALARRAVSPSTSRNVRAAAFPAGVGRTTAGERSKGMGPSCVSPAAAYTPSASRCARMTYRSIRSCSRPSGTGRRALARRRTTTRSSSQYRPVKRASRLSGQRGIERIRDHYPRCRILGLLDSPKVCHAARRSSSIR